MCFQQLQEANLSLRLDKCEFAKPQVLQFGLEISHDGCRPSDENIHKIKLYPKPNCMKEVRRFLGMANYYREFISKFAEVTEPIQELLRSNTPFVWTEDREKSFTEIKQKLSDNCILNFLDWNRDFIIELDASKVAACGILMQENDKKECKILGYHSSTLDLFSGRHTFEV